MACDAHLRENVLLLSRVPEIAEGGTFLIAPTDKITLGTFGRVRKSKVY